MRSGLPAWLLTSAALVACAGATPYADESGTGYGDTIPRRESSRNDYAPFLGLLVPGLEYHQPLEAPPQRYVDPLEADLALVWSMPFVVKAGEWRHSGAFSLADVMRSGAQIGRAVYRFELVSWAGDDPLLHWLVGAGPLYHSEHGGGIRGETGILLGEHGEGGALLLLGYENALAGPTQIFEVTLSPYIPYVFE